MPHIANPYRGHMRPGDPRTLVTAAGGCTWPTVPPYRLIVTSDNATGLYSGFNSHNVLLELDPDETTHARGVWYAIDRPIWLYRIVLEKIWIRDQHPQFRWWLSILITLVGRVEIAVVLAGGKCNRDVLFGNQIGGPIRGRVGSTFRFEQVEFDATAP